MTATVNLRISIISIVRIFRRSDGRALAPNLQGKISFSTERGMGIMN
jgi:hypothetical protein